MFGRRKQTSTRIDTLLGRTANLHGDLEFSGGLHLDGRVNGNVRSNADDGGALSVSESGFIEGRVEVTLTLQRQRLIEIIDALRLRAVVRLAADQAAEP